jgi:hypothetical protein
MRIMRVSADQTKDRSAKIRLIRGIRVLLLAPGCGSAALCHINVPLRDPINN